jgi:hypothetical protein
VVRRRRCVAESVISGEGVPPKSTAIGTPDAVDCPTPVTVELIPGWHDSVPAARFAEASSGWPVVLRTYCPAHDSSLDALLCIAGTSDGRYTLIVRCESCSGGSRQRGVVNVAIYEEATHQYRVRITEVGMLYLEPLRGRVPDHSVAYIHFEDEEEIGSCPAEIHLVDPLARQTGFDPDSESVLDAIPRSRYDHSSLGRFRSEPCVDPDQLGLIPKLELARPMPGVYRLVVVGLGTGAFRLVVNDTGSDTTRRSRLELSSSIVEKRVEFALRRSDEGVWELLPSPLLP